MKIVIQEKNTFFLRFDKGEEIIEDLKKFCQENKIKAGYFQAIGAAGEIILSYFDSATKEYQDHEIKEDLEITSLLGNIAIFDNEIIIHAHGTFAKRDLSLFGGHVKKLIVSVTCEMSLQIFEKEIKRKPDEETRLKLLD